MSFKDALAAKRSTLDKARTAARIEKELAQIRAMLRAGPVTTKQVIAATGWTDSVTKSRLRAVGGVWVRERGYWKLAERK